MKRKKPLQRGKPPKRKTRVKAQNKKRAKKKYERNFGEHADWIRTHVCCSCGRPGSDNMTIQAAHAKARGMGGCGGDKKDLVPLCFTCHDEETRGVREIVAVVQWVPGTPSHYMYHETITLREAAGYFWKASPHYEESA